MGNFQNLKLFIYNLHATTWKNNLKQFIKKTYIAGIRKYKSSIRWVESITAGPSCSTMLCCRWLFYATTMFSSIPGFDLLDTNSSMSLSSVLTIKNMSPNLPNVLWRTKLLPVANHWPKLEELLQLGLACITFRLKILKVVKNVFWLNWFQFYKCYISLRKSILHKVTFKYSN